MPEKVLEALTKIKSTISCKMIEEIQNDQYERNAVLKTYEMEASKSLLHLWLMTKTRTISKMLFLELCRKRPKVPFYQLR